MKKIISLLLAFVMVFSLATVAAADTYTDASTITFTKNYNASGASAVSPAEIFEFENIAFVSATQTGVDYTEDWAKANLPTISTVSYDKGAAGSETKTGTFTVTLPTNYPSVGIYTYSFNEKDNNVEGVTYNATQMKLVVTVVEENGLKRVAAIHCEGATGDKTNMFDNTYSAGTLAVTKKVTGNLGDHNKAFEITVTFNANDGDTVMSDITYTNPGETEVTTIAGNWTTKEVKINLKHNETVTFNNIPEGVTYTVVESDYTSEAAGKYDAASYDFSDETGKLISAGDADTVEITNNKSTTVDTGIALDSAPYFVILAVAMFGMVALVSKKRYEV